MKKKIFFRWNNIWNICFAIFLGILIYIFIFEQEFLLSSGQDDVFLKIKDKNHKKIKPNSTKQDCAIIVDYSKKRKEILQKLYGRNINENINMIYK